ncbi:MAG TPA: TadE/TadG family type IV pilus assembly protein [Streptosporangiaceae bacterium]|nr:TadE/TadG family type IV pilus assembly protein [Streptosporangiaceae bacterium]
MRSGREGTKSAAGGRKPRGDRGASSLELALLTPVLLLVILFVVQFALWYHARHVALAAAQAGARVARGDVTGDWRSAAKSKAESYAQQIGPSIITGVVANPTGGADERFVDVEGDAVTVIPFRRWHVHQRAGGPTECFRPDRDGGVSCEPRP